MERKKKEEKIQAKMSKENEILSTLSLGILEYLS